MNPNGAKGWCRPLLGLILCLTGSLQLQAHAQQLDLDTHRTKPRPANQRPIERYIPPDLPSAFRQRSTSQLPTSPRPISQRYVSPGSNSKRQTEKNTSQPPRASTPASTQFSNTPALSATVTHTLYLPPAMYGEWNVSGRLIETNAPDLYSPLSNDIWLLEREGNDITVTNPTNGARASVSVDRAEGDQATFHRSGTAGSHSIYQEIPTITVHGDTFSGKSLNKLQDIKNGQVVNEVYGIYQLEATRIGAARTRFRPEAEQQEPDLEIDEIHHPAR